MSLHDVAGRSAALALALALLVGCGNQAGSTPAPTGPAPTPQEAGQSNTRINSSFFSGRWAGVRDEVNYTLNVQTNGNDFNAVFRADNTLIPGYFEVYDLRGRIDPASKTMFITSAVDSRSVPGNTVVPGKASTYVNARNSLTTDGLLDFLGVFLNKAS